MRLVVDFHGAGSNMAQQDIYSGFDALADKKGFVVATPNGIDAAIRQWRFLGTHDDVKFAKAIVGDLAEDACVDAAHAYAAGISSGGAMTASLACQASDTFAGFGPVAADFYLPPLCAKARSRPIIIFHGTADPVVPYNGGQVGTSADCRSARRKRRLPRGRSTTAARRAPTRTRLGSQVVRLSWSGCTAPVVMYQHRRRRAHVARSRDRRDPARSHDPSGQRNGRDVEVLLGLRLINTAWKRSGPTWTRAGESPSRSVRRDSEQPIGRTGPEHRRGRAEQGREVHRERSRNAQAR